MLTLIILSIFLSVALLTGLLLYPVLSKRDLVRGRVAGLMSQEEARPELVPVPKKWQTVLANLGTKLRVRPADLSTYGEMVTTGGFKRENVYVFLGGKLLLAAALPAVYLIFFSLPQKQMFTRQSIMIALICAISGYLLPTWWLKKRADDRKREIFHTLPDVLDLLTVSVEAGLSVDAALIRAVDNFEDHKNPLIQEINRVTLEVRAGRLRSEALKGLAERTMVDDIKALVALLVQTEKFGTSLGKTLRTYSDSLRMKRKQLAEEEAAKTAVKMLFPLTFCVFPALLVVMLAPAFVRMMEMFKKH